MPIRGFKHSPQCRKYTNFFYSKKKRSNPPFKELLPLPFIGLVWRYYLTATTLPEWRSTTIA